MSQYLSPALSRADGDGVPGPTVLHSAETYVEEPGDLWTAGLPRRFRDKAFRLNRFRNGWGWVRGNGRILANRREVKRERFEGTTSEDLISMLNEEQIFGAVLYPSVAARVFAAFREPNLLDALFAVYNDWILDLAASARDRLRAIALLNVDDPAAAARAMRSLSVRGAGGFVLPLAPGEGWRYDQPRYEVLWRTAAEVGRPLSLLAGGLRNLGTAAEEGPRSTLATRLAFKGTSIFPARRSITAIIFAGVFERYPALRIGVVGFDAAWAAYAMVRADEMYEVRPERTGPPTGVTREFDHDRAIQHLEREAGVPIASDARSGTVGMAPEGVGYHFPRGQQFSDHFRRNIFLTFCSDSLGIALRGLIGVKGMLWGIRDFWDRGERRTHDVNSHVREVSGSDRHWLISGNTARIYGFGR